MLFGYAKVVFLGNYLVGTKFAGMIGALDVGSWLYHYLDTLRYGLLLYLRFAGYSDIAIGFALLLGFRVMENFNLPFLASNIWISGVDGIYPFQPGAKTTCTRRSYRSPGFPCSPLWPAWSCWASGMKCRGVTCSGARSTVQASRLASTGSGVNWQDPLPAAGSGVLCRSC